MCLEQLFHGVLHTELYSALQYFERFITIHYIVIRCNHLKLYICSKTLCSFLKLSFFRLLKDSEIFAEISDKVFDDNRIRNPFWAFKRMDFSECTNCRFNCVFLTFACPKTIPIRFRRFSL